MTFPDLLMIWSIRLALLLMVLVILGRCRDAGEGAPDRQRWRALRALWVTGCLLAVLHVLAVFGYAMHWSHQAALADTARRTAQVIGISFGGGLYFNYAFLLVWICDVLWWCGWPERYRRRARLWEVLVIGYLGFIAFNATVVFETGALRWLGLLATCALALTGFRAWVARK